MSTKEIEVNGNGFRIILTDQIISQVNNLKSLYSANYDDPESFEQVGAETSSIINEIADAVEPRPSDNDLHELIEEIMKVVDDKAAQIEKELKTKVSSARKKDSSKKASKKPKTKK